MLCAGVPVGAAPKRTSTWKTFWGGLGLAGVAGVLGEEDEPEPLEEPEDEDEELEDPELAPEELEDPELVPEELEVDAGVDGEVVEVVEDWTFAEGRGVNGLRGVPACRRAPLVVSDTASLAAGAWLIATAPSAPVVPEAPETGGVELDEESPPPSAA